MVYGLYSIFDKVAGMYGNPFVQLNDNTAIRYFKSQMNQVQFEPTDFDLYKVGTFEPESGAVANTLEFIVHGEVANEA
ncbi:nonstructural protein [Dipodfec virus UOA04_Rod_986]|nr:nonstructural protein [Dipodfec virus UOA04_Rod_986]